MNDGVTYVEENALLARIYARMPVDVQMSFTPEQIAALGAATFEAPAPHRIAIRKTFGLLGRHYYFAVFAGKDRRRDTAPVQHHVSDEFRADWRYLLMMVLMLCAGLALLCGVLLSFWLIVASLAGGQYPSAPAAINEFLSK